MSVFSLLVPQFVKVFDTYATNNAAKVFWVPFLAHRGNAATIGDGFVAFCALRHEIIVEILLTIRLAIFLAKGCVLRERYLTDRTKEVVRVP